MLRLARPQAMSLNGLLAERAGSVGEAQGAGELPGWVANRNRLFVKAGGFGVVRRRPRSGGFCGHDEESSNAEFGIEHPFEGQRRLLEL